MQKIFWIYLFFIFLGFILLLLPETGGVLISVNDYHGPSFIDIAGLVLIVISWIIMLVTAIKRYKKISSNLGSKRLTICITTVIAGTIWVVVSLLKNTQHAWVTGAVVAIAGYAVLFYVAYKKE